MNINDLPNDCLLTIFDHLNLNYFEDYVRLSAVCPRWTELIDHKLTKVKYLLQDPEHYYLDHQNYFGPVPKKYDPSLKTLRMKHPKKVKRIKLSNFLPNLKIFDAVHLNVEEKRKLLEDNPSIEGFISIFESSKRQIEPFGLEKMKMVATNFPNSYYDKCYSKKLTQLNLLERRPPLISVHIAKLTNLSRLHIHRYCPTKKVRPARLLTNLKIFEFGVESESKFDCFPGYSFMDNFPSLESAFFYSTAQSASIDESTKNHNLKDLVIEWEYAHITYPQNWTCFRRLLTKFPNLKHLAIRGNKLIIDDNIKELVNLLPEVTLLDFRGSVNVTRESADFLKSFCKDSGRSIVIYYGYCNNDPPDWPKLGDSEDIICSGFDFMRNCFFKFFDQLPLFLDS